MTPGLSRSKFVVSSAAASALAVCPLGSFAGVEASPNPSPSGSALPPAPFRIARAGSTFRFLEKVDGKSREIEIEVGDVEDRFVNYVADGQRVQGYLIVPHGPSGLTNDDKNKLIGLWPLEVGKSARYWRRDRSVGYGIAWLNDVSVARTQRLDLGELTIDTYAVLWKSEAANPSHQMDNSFFWIGTSMSWFAPALGWIIYRKYEERWRGGGRTTELTLLGHKLKSSE